MRLQRIGRKNDPSFRVVVTDSRRGPKSGKHVDIIGSYNPKMDRVQIDADAAKSWIAKGVQVSDTLHNLLITEKIIEGKKVNVLPKKTPIIAPAVPSDKVGQGEAKSAESAGETTAEESATETPAPSDATENGEGQSPEAAAEDANIENVEADSVEKKTAKPATEQGTPSEEDTAEQEKT